MSKSKKRGDQILRTSEQARELLLDLVNVPDEQLLESLLNLSEQEREDLQEDHPEIANLGKAVRHFRTSAYKQLFDLTPDEPAQVSDRRLIELFKGLRLYLRQFWGTTDVIARDWYIYRAREYYQRFRIQRNTAAAREADMAAAKVEERAAVLSRWNVKLELKLDSPPVPSLLEEALFYLQSTASKALQCPNPACRRYFLATKKGQKFCTVKCARPTLLASKRKSWDKHKHEWGKK